MLWLLLAVIALTTEVRFKCFPRRQVKISHYFLVFKEDRVITINKANQWLVKNTAIVQSFEMVSRAFGGVFPDYLLNK